jgi:hypothetical protein
MVRDIIRKKKFFEGYFRKYMMLYSDASNGCLMIAHKISVCIRNLLKETSFEDKAICYGMYIGIQSYT